MGGANSWEWLRHGGSTGDWREAPADKSQRGTHLQLAARQLRGGRDYFRQQLLVLGLDGAVQNGHRLTGAADQGGQTWREWRDCQKLGQRSYLGRRFWDGGGGEGLASARPQSAT